MQLVLQRKIRNKECGVKSFVVLKLCSKDEVSVNLVQYTHEQTLYWRKASPQPILRSFDEILGKLKLRNNLDKILKKFFVK